MTDQIHQMVSEEIETAISEELTNNNQDVNDVCLAIQKRFAITDGGYCGMFINDENWEESNLNEKADLLTKWLFFELPLQE